jgi:7,8-dihydroneopterin aldolase/epimerase/oxygenase
MPDTPEDCYRLLVQDVEIDCFLGVYAHEQQSRRPIIVDVEIHVPVAPRDPSGPRDELAGTVNYEAIVESIERIAGSRRFALVETLCAELLDDMILLAGVRAIKVSVTKPQPLPRAKSVRVELWRQA